MKKVLILVLIIVLLGGIVGGGLYGAIQVSKLDTIFPGVSIDGTDVSGLTKEEAAQLLDAGGWEEKISTPLTVNTLGGFSFNLDPKTAGTGIPAIQLADEAYRCGRDGNLITNLISYIGGRLGFNRMQVVSMGRPADREYVAGCVEKAISSVEENLNMNEFVIDNDNAVLRVVKGAGQISFDRNAFVDAVVAALESGKTELSYTKLAREPELPDFAAINDSMPHESRDASFTDDGTFEVIDEIVSCEFDVSEAERIWNEAAAAEEVLIPLNISVPAVTGDSLRGMLYRDLLGTMTTYYPNSNDNRRNNLRLATEKINGTILYPGDVFSYNEVVGERTEEAGFLPAAAYVNGSEKEEIGGGACQVSSTLYSATLFAFLESVERENHYFAVSYIQIGTDATVTIPTDGGRAIDFKFRNNKNYPIKIVGYTNNDESSITFEIWGTIEDDDYMPIELDNSYNGQYPAVYQIEKADPNRPGYVIKLVHETYTFTDDVGSGYRTLTWRRVYDEAGNLVSEELTNMLNELGQPGMDTYYFHY